MILESIEASELAIPFKEAFKHAAAERHSTQSLWVRAREAGGETGFGEGCPRMPLPVRVYGSRPVRP